MSTEIATSHDGCKPPGQAGEADTEIDEYEAQLRRWDEEEEEELRRRAGDPPEYEEEYAGGPTSVSSRPSVSRHVPKPKDANAGPKSDQKSATVAALNVIYADELAAQPAPPRVWLVEDVIPGNAVTLLASDGGGGKTTLALQLEVAAAYGLEWLGMKVKQGNVLHYTAEDEPGEIHFRLAPLLSGQAQPEHRLAIYSALSPTDATPQDPTLAKPDRTTGKLEFTKLCDTLERYIADNKVVLLVIDALAEVFGGNENDRYTTAQFIRRLQHIALKRGCAIVILAHPSVQAMVTGRGYSGSTHWNAGPKARLYLESMSDGRRTLTLEKSNRSLATWERKLRWQDGCFVVETPQAVDLQARRQKAEEVFLSLLETYENRGVNVSSNANAKNYAPTRFSKDDDSKGMKKADLAGAMGRLLDGRRIENVEVKVDGHTRMVLRLKRDAN